MAVKIVVPSFGESVTEGTIAHWLKKDGAFVKKDDVLLEIESEKATQGIPAPATGILHITAKEGDRVAVGSVIGSIEESTAAPAKAPESAKAVSSVKAAYAEKDAFLSPAARRLAAAEGVDVSKITGTGRHGIVLKENVQEHLAASKADGAPSSPEAPTPAAANKQEKRVPMSAIRQRIAERLLASQKSTASLTTFNEADMSAIMDLRTTYKEKFKEKYGIQLGFMSFFVKASIEALRAFPVANASIDGRDVVFHNSHHIGVAVSTEKGLMVPVLHDADKMNFGQIEKAIADLAVKARDGKINLTDLQGGTFTITNGGIFGSLMSTPILNFPQTAILGMHTIQKRPVVRDDQIVIRPMMYVALTYDHRLIDGREAVLFLIRIKECLEDPQRLLLEI